MRFLLKEQLYEKRLAAGELRYEQDGRPTGAIEHWRYTHAHDGYHFWRVDLDGRASSGDTFLYNLLLDPHGRPADLRWRFYNASNRAHGQILFEAGQMTAVREINGQRFEQEVPPAPFFFPSVAGLWLLRGVQGGRVALQTLAMHQREPEAFMALVPLTAELAQAERTTVLRWGEQERRSWWDAQGFPERMERQDGLTAVGVGRGK
ncbi:MAG: hypothetical protein OT477_08910 [Chloroflexi bacterium]|nr:hypothetical protein [Chloroflexota bacterium]